MLDYTLDGSIVKIVDIDAPDSLAPGSAFQVGANLLLFILHNLDWTMDHDDQGRHRGDDGRGRDQVNMTALRKQGGHEGRQQDHQDGQKNSVICGQEHHDHELKLYDPSTGHKSAGPARHGVPDRMR